MSTPEQVPDQLVVGDTWVWTRSLTDYPASTYTGAWYFENKSSQISISAVASGDIHTVSVAKATTAAYTAGEYRWRFVATKISDSTRTSVESGWVSVLADPAATGRVDWRSHARKTLAAIEAVIEGRATTDQESMSINGRSISRISIADLLKFRDYYKAEVSSEKAAEAVAAGLGSPKRIYVRFGRV
jgi:hypothetical protein